MLHFIGRRLMVAIPTLFIISVMVFSLQLITPGDPALMLLGEDKSPEALAYIREQYHLDKPVLVQYGYWMSGVLQGDLGVSMRTNIPVTELILQKLPITIELAILSILIALMISIPMGVISAVKKGTRWDFGANMIALIGQSVPNFWLGFMLILLVSVNWGLLPASGYVSPADSLVDNLRSMLMPALVLGTGLAAVLFRHTRSAMLEVLKADYVRTAKAKGLKGRVVIIKHALRNALIPVVTLTALQFGELLGGAVLTEQVFNIPGIGKLIVDAVFNRDYMVVQGVVLFSAVMFILMNLLADIAYFILNPRLRHAGGVA